MYIIRLLVFEWTSVTLFAQVWFVDCLCLFIFIYWSQDILVKYEMGGTVDLLCITGFTLTPQSRSGVFQ